MSIKLSLSKKCLSNYASFLPLKSSCLGKQMFSGEQQIVSLGKALIFHGLPMCPLPPLTEESAEQRALEEWCSTTSLSDSVVSSVTFCSPRGRWEGAQHLLLFPQEISSSPVSSVQLSGFFALNRLSVHVYQLLGPRATKRGNGKMRNFPYSNPLRPKGKKKKLLQKYCLAPFAINRIYSVTKVRLVSIHHPLLPFVNRKAVRDLLTLLGWRSLQAQVSCRHSFLNSKMKPRQWPALQILYQITSQAPKEYVWCRESHTFAAAWKGISSSLLLLFWFWQCFWVSGHDPITCHGLPLLQCLPPLPPYSLKDMMIDLFYCFLHLCFIYFCSDLYDFFPSSNFGLCFFSSCFRCKVLMLFEILVSQGKIVSL